MDRLRAIRQVTAMHEVRGNIVVVHSGLDRSYVEHTTPISIGSVWCLVKKATNLRLRRISLYGAQLLAEMVRMIRRSGLFAPPQYHVIRV